MRFCSLNFLTVFLIPHICMFIGLEFVQGLRVFGNALDSSFRKARIANFKTKEAERELFRFRQEVKAQNEKQAELHARALVRAERRGRKMVAAEVARRAESFAAEFQCFKEAQEFVGDFAKVPGSVVNLYKSQNPDFSFDSEIAEMKDFMADCAMTDRLSLCLLVISS
ncbi:hypothetical protein Bca101_025677 [Brassica carinata]